MSPDLPRLPPIALGVSSGIVCKSGSSTVMMPGSGLRTAPRRPPSCPPPTSFSIRFSVTSWPRRLGEEDLSEVVEEVVGRGTVTAGVLLSPELVEPGELGFIKYSETSSFAKSVRFLVSSASFSEKGGQRGAFLKADLKVRRRLLSTLFPLSDAQQWHLRPTAPPTIILRGIKSFVRMSLGEILPVLWRIVCVTRKNPQHLLLSVALEVFG